MTTATLRRREGTIFGRRYATTTVELPSGHLRVTTIHDPADARQKCTFVQPQLGVRRVRRGTTAPA